ncbi:MAG: histidinol dehydrogenase, partial [Halomonas sp.]
MKENATATIARLNTVDEMFAAQLNALLDWEGVSDSAVQERVNDILTNVKRHGDAAVIEATNRFDRVSVTHMDELRLTAEQLRQAF